MNEGALATLDDDAAIAEIASGVLSKHIAVRYGVTPYAVRKRLAKHPDYVQAIKDQAESIAESATDEALRLEEGCDMVAIARARVKVETAYKWAAARDPDRWNPKSGTINIINGITVDQALDSIAGSLLDKVRTVASQSVAETPIVQCIPCITQDGEDKG